MLQAEAETHFVLHIIWHLFRLESHCNGSTNVTVTVHCHIRQDRQKVFWVCVCSPNYPACSEHAPHCIVIYSMFGFTVFFHIINGTIFGKTLLNRQCVVIFSTNLSETFLFLRRIQRYKVKNVYWSSCNPPPHYCKILEKREFCGQIFDKTHTKFH